MFQRWAITIVVIAALPFAAARTHAAVALSLGSDAAELGQLSIGVPVNFSVELSGLTGGQELDGLFATVGFDGALLGTPTTLTAGPIVPQALDFLTVTQPGLADGAFQTLSTQTTDHISTEGTFYSFQVTPQNTGTGTVSFQFVDAFQFNNSNPNAPINIGADAGASLNFTVSSGVAGDYNSDGRVNAADVTVWRNNRGNTGSPGIPGDGSGPSVGTPDGVVDQLDYEFWRSRFGATAGAAVGAAIPIPEPNSLWLFALAGICFGGSRFTSHRVSVHVQSSTL